MARWLNQYKELSRKLHLVGSGGNINKIKKLYGNESDGFVTFDKIAKAYRQLKKISVEERIISLNLRPDRADVIVPATEIFLFIEKVIKVEKVFIPRIGLTDGIVYSLYHELISKQSVIA
jgi:exopolyphosphatase/guanosine-5'-triphosphate,3'-diphosphate pyrophosphatase